MISKTTANESKEAGKDVGEVTRTGATKSAKAVKKGAMKAGHATTSETEKGAEIVKDKTK